MNLLNNPEKRKWMIVVTIFIAIICNYLDRQLLSILKPTIKAAFDMNDDGYAFIVNIFRYATPSCIPYRASWSTGSARKR